MNKFSERLKELRTDAGLSQAKLSELTKISQAAIGRWELNQRTPTIENVIALCKVFKCSADYIIGLED